MKIICIVIVFFIVCYSQYSNYRRNKIQRILIHNWKESMKRLNNHPKQDDALYNTSLNTDHADDNMIHKVLYNNKGDIIGYENQMVGSDIVRVGYLLEPIKKGNINK